MTNTKQFIEDAIEGGWGNAHLVTRNVTVKNNRVTLKYEECEGGGWTSKWSEKLAVEQILLDPLAWQAVGKTRGWGDYKGQRHYAGERWRDLLHQYIDHLADDKAIEEALTEIT